MFRHARQLVTAVTILAIFQAHSPCKSQDLTNTKVQKSIDEGVRFLLGQQQPDGSWPDYSGQDNQIGGVTSLVVLALINCGHPPGSNELRKALKHLQSLKPEKTYAVSLQTMAFCAANPRQFAIEIQRNVKWLVETQLPNGGWSYPSGGQGDPSNAQFALLALHEAQRANVYLEKSDWQRVFTRAADYWKRIQNNDGSFPYISTPTQPDQSGSMTCAGIASLVIAGSELDSTETQAEAASVKCCGRAEGAEDRVRAGLDWLAKNYSIQGNPGSPAWHFYYLYALERVGRMTGQRLIGQHDWYREGAAELLGKQDIGLTGRFMSTSQHESNDIISTAMALLFLSKGKRQIVVSRLQHGPGEDWNHHSRAIQHLTVHTEQAWKRDLAWQTIDIRRSTLADLLESPVLFISGSSIFQIDAAAKRNLREYVEQGGFIFAEACDQDGCRGADFDQAFRRFVVDVFQQPLEKLAPDHPIWFAQTRVDPKNLPHDFWLYGVQSCCRLGLVYSPISLSCRWELNMPYGSKPDYSPVIQGELDNATKVGLNVLAYATGKQLKEKLDLVSVLEDTQASAPSDRGIFVLPKLMHNAGADDAPRAIPTLLKWLNRENPFKISDEHRMIAITESELEKYPIVFTHGRRTLRLGEAERDALRRYLEHGGFLFVDSICSSEEFAESFRLELGLILPNSRLEKLPANHAMLSGEKYKGFNIREVTLFDPTSVGENVTFNRRLIPPQLEYARIEDRIVVVFSPLDISCALESKHSLQCRGYTREDAARIGINVLLYALQE